QRRCAQLSGDRRGSLSGFATALCLCEEGASRRHSRSSPVPDPLCGQLGAEGAPGAPRADRIPACDPGALAGDHRRRGHARPCGPAVMTGVVLLILIVGLGLIAWATTRMRALGFRRRTGTRISSLPHHHGWYVALWTAAPPLLFLAIWAATSPALVTDMVLG